MPSGWDILFPTPPQSPSTPAASSDSTPLQALYAQSMPPIIAPPHTTTYLLEASLSSLGVPFHASLLGRLPPELRIKIYTVALTISPIPEYLEHPYRQQWTYERTPQQWMADREPQPRKYAQRRWPNSSPSSPNVVPFTALTATFPPRSKPRAMSHLELLLTCRQIYAEAWDIYYIVNDFVFETFADFNRFCGSLTVGCLQRLASVDVSIRHGDEARTVGFLVRCEGLRKLRIKMDERAVGMLRNVRGLRDVRVDVRWMGSSSKDERERVLAQARNVEALMREPRGGDSIRGDLYNNSEPSPKLSIEFNASKTE